MSREIEQRLVELFETIDGQLEVQPSPVHRRSKPRWPVLAMAASIMAILVGAAVIVETRLDAPIGPAAVGPVAAIPAAEFDRAADAICVELSQARNGIAPRFRTPEAFSVAVAARRSAIDAAVAALSLLPPPADDLALASTVADALRATRIVLEDVDRAARAGLLEEAASEWARVDPAIDEAVAPLAWHGAPACGHDE